MRSGRWARTMLASNDSAEVTRFSREVGNANRNRQAGASVIAKALRFVSSTSAAGSPPWVRLTPTGGHVSYLGNIPRPNRSAGERRVACQLQRLQIFDQIVNLLITEGETEEAVVVLHHFAQR